MMVAIKFHVDNHSAARQRNKLFFLVNAGQIVSEIVKIILVLVKGEGKKCFRPARGGLSARGLSFID